MSDMPAWYAQLRWSDPIAFSEFVTGSRPRAAIPSGAGLYVFTRDPSALNSANALYVGKADGVHRPLRRRLGIYIRRLRHPGGAKSGHPGLEKLNAHYAGGQAQALFVRWCGCILTREVEGGLIDMFDPEFNGKDERLGLADDELIPDIYLYDV